jgi:tetratricopeptide (TPR) repeat protein
MVDMQDYLTKRTASIVGREKEIADLAHFLKARGESHFVYCYAHGGYGKTRLLEKLQEMVAEAGPGVVSSGIIDLYHTDTHSTSDVERTIVEALDPKEEFFSVYRRARKDYELLRERGADPITLERWRRELGELFVTSLGNLAHKRRKLVLSFDTVEHLQHESSTVEALIDPETADTRLKPWLLDKLPRLHNVLVVFAGRPRVATQGDEVDLQQRFMENLREDFRENLVVRELEPFTLEETKALIESLVKEEGAELVPEAYLPIVHKLVGGKPIYIHLVVDLLQTLHPEPRLLFDLFDKYQELSDLPVDDPRLEAPRNQIEQAILDSLFNQTGELGGYLSRIALMPKGVNAELLEAALGMPRPEAEALLARLEPLSFIKRFKAPAREDRLHPVDFFLHDEMYRLLTLQDAIPNLRMNERAIAKKLISEYYEPRIQELKAMLAEGEERLVEQSRSRMTERLQKLQVERMYYLLVINPREGYTEYKRLSDVANHHRRVDFAMRLLDEFLRFYSIAERRELLHNVGLSHEQITRESVWLWVERFDWWGQDERLIRLAKRVTDNPEKFLIDPERDLAVLGNIYGFWVGAEARKNGYQEVVVEQALEMLGRLPLLEACTPEQALARFRLSVAIGYQHRLGGMMGRALKFYREAKVAALQLGRERVMQVHHEEYALLLSSMAFAHAIQGHMAVARPLAHEALRINEERGNQYSTGLTLATLSQIASMQENYAKAYDYAMESLDVFLDLGESRGIATARLRIAQSLRKKAKHEIEKGRRLEAAGQVLKDALKAATDGLTIAQEEQIGSVIPQLLAESGRIHREMGRLTSLTESLEKSLPDYREAERLLRAAIDVQGWGRMDQLDVQRDLSEVFFRLGDREAALNQLKQIEVEIGQEFLIRPGGQPPDENLPGEPFEPLGRVEMLRADINFTEGCPGEGLRHYLLAYAYFILFSPETLSLESMMEHVYNRMREKSLDEQREILDYVRDESWMRSLGLDVYPFVEKLEYLFGV